MLTEREERRTTIAAPTFLSSCAATHQLCVSYYAYYVGRGGGALWVGRRPQPIGGTSVLVWVRSYQ